MPACVSKRRTGKAWNVCCAIAPGRPSRWSDCGKPNLVLVEALPEKYFRDWHLPGAKHLPHDQVKALAPALLPDDQAEIVTYCAKKWLGLSEQNSPKDKWTLSGWVKVQSYPRPPASAL